MADDTGTADYAGDRLYVHTGGVCSCCDERDGFKGVPGRSHVASHARTAAARARRGCRADGGMCDRTGIGSGRVCVGVLIPALGENGAPPVR